MNWKQAQREAKRVNCKHAVAVALKSGPGKRPPDDALAMVLCKEKVRQGWADDACNKKCPE